MKARAIVVSIPLFLICFDQNLRADVVTEWNEAALNAIRASNTPPPAASRTLAILHTAIYDAVNGILRTHTPYLVTGQFPPVRLQRLLPRPPHTTCWVVYTRHYRLALMRLTFMLFENIKDGPQKASGIAWGAFVASSLLNLRSTDGSGTLVNFLSGTEVGQWRPTASFGGQVRPALLPQWVL